MAEITKYLDTCQKGELIQVEGKKRRQRFSIPFTMEGLCAALGVSRKTLMTWEDEETFPDLAPIVAQAKRIIWAKKVEGAMVGTYHPGFTQFLLKNNADYRDVKERKLEIEQPDAQVFIIGGKKLKF